LKTLTLFALISAVCTSAFTPSLSSHQTARKKSSVEQARFNMDTEFTPVRHPARISKAALSVLMKDQLIRSCLQYDGIPDQELPENWFLASQIHLNGPKEVDLVVLPSGRLPDTPGDEASPNACLLGARTGGFWILRSTPSGYELVLSQMAVGLDILNSRTHGFRDVRLYTTSLSTTLIQDFRFDGKRYRLFRAHSRPNS
jgi:hypothetical protein